MELHKIDVHENVIRDDGMFFWHSQGRLVAVGDQEYVELPHGTLVRRTPAWKASRSEALLEAAEKVEAFAARLTAQVDRIRAEEGSHATA